MKAVNLALVALAGFGLVTSEVAYADTLPGAALPAVSHLHPVKLARLTGKRDGTESRDASIPPYVYAGAAVVGGLGFLVGWVSRGHSYVYVSPGG
jgi:hypothetical protein